MNPAPDPETSDAETSDAETSHAETSDPAASGTAGAATSRRSPWARWTAIFVAVLVMAFLSGAFIVYRAYDNATKPDLSSPETAVSNFLQALLNDRDDTEAAKYSCSDQSGLAPIRSYRDTAVGRAESQGADVSFDWVLAVHRGASQSDVSADLQLVAATEGVTATSHSTWDFVAAKQSGWRVCSATQQPRLPSPTSSLGP